MISVVVPVYNVEKYLQRCVESIINQTEKDIEIILVDDGSTDNSGNICDGYLEKDPRIFVIHQKNQGLSVARNVGIKNSKGEYITFVDSDDYIHKDMLKVLLDNLIHEQGQISFCRYEEGNENRLAISECDLKYTGEAHDGKEYLLNPPKGMGISIACAKLYKKECFDNIEFPAGKLHEDDFTTYKAFINSSRVVYVPIEMYYYYRHGDSITCGKKSVKHLSYIEAYYEQNLLWGRNEPLFSEKYISYIMEQFYMDCRSNQINYKENCSLYKEYINYFKKLFHEYKKANWMTKRKKLQYAIFCIGEELLVK